MAAGVRLGDGARVGRGLPSGKAALAAGDPFGEHGSGGLTWVWPGWVWAR